MTEEVPWHKTLNNQAVMQMIQHQQREHSLKRSEKARRKKERARIINIKEVRVSLAVKTQSHDIKLLMKILLTKMTKLLNKI